MVVSALLAIYAQQWNFTGSKMNLSSVVDSIQRTLPNGVILDITEQIPATAQADLKIKTDQFDYLMFDLAEQTPIRFIFPKNGESNRWQMVWSDGSPPKGSVRLYEESGGYVLSATSVSVAKITDTIKDRLEFDPRPIFVKAGLVSVSEIDSFKTKPRTARGIESIEQFCTRLANELAKKDTPKPLTSRAVWNLTFLPGSPPALGEVAKVNFGDASSPNVSASSLAQALNAAYAPMATVKPTEAPPVPEVRVTAVGSSSLVIEGRSDLVSHIKRLLATQIDVSQSQILLELDSYTVSSSINDRDEADRSIRQFLLAQEIAQAYKRSYYAAVKDMLIGLDSSIDEVLKTRDNFPVDSKDLFRRCGIDPSSTRQLGLTDVLVLLAYCDNKDLITNYMTAVACRFELVHDSLENRVINPMSKSKSKVELALAAQLRELNDSIRDGCSNWEKTPDKKKYDASALLTSYAKSDKKGEYEDAITRTSIEEFLILWLATIDSTIFDKLLEADEVDELEITDNRELAYIQALGVKSLNPDSKAKKNLVNLLNGDRTQKLSRAASYLDLLVAEGVTSLQADSAHLVDLPFDRWIADSILHNQPQFKFGGSTKLAVTSRVPGKSGAESETFFPFKTVSPIGLESLIPLLSRDREALGSEGTDTSSMLQKGGATPLEIAALQAIFDQANKMPYDRKLGTGIHFSVLPTVLPNAGTARLQIKLSLSVEPDEANKGGQRSIDKPSPIDLMRVTTVETELLADAFDISLVSSMKLDVTAPSTRDWEVPILSQILPIRSWFVGPTKNKSVRHEALVLMKITIVPKAMDIASRLLDGAN